MRFGIRDVADVDEIRFLSHAERLGRYSVRVTDTTFLSRERHTVPRAVFLTPPEPSDGSSHEVE